MGECNTIVSVYTLYRHNSIAHTHRIMIDTLLEGLNAPLRFAIPNKSHYKRPIKFTLFKNSPNDWVGTTHSLTNRKTGDKGKRRFGPYNQSSNKRKKHYQSLFISLRVCACGVCSLPIPRISV